MDEIRRQDLKVFLREFLSLTRMLIVLCAITLVILKVTWDSWQTVRAGPTGHHH